MIFRKNRKRKKEIKKNEDLKWNIKSKKWETFEKKFRKKIKSLQSISKSYQIFF